MIDLLRRLIDKSLITVVERAGEARYRVLETLRQYGRQQLRESGEHYDTCLRYSGWVMQLIHAAPPPSVRTRTSRTAVGPSEANWLDVCERELDHLRAVLSWMIDHNHSQAAHGITVSHCAHPVLAPARIHQRRTALARGDIARGLVLIRRSASITSRAGPQCAGCPLDVAGRLCPGPKMP